MKLPLKYFLLICLLLGAVVAPIGYRKYQEWKKRRAAIPTRTFVIKNLVADEVKAVIEAVYSEAAKPVDGELPTVIVRADPRTNSVIVRGSPEDVLVVEDVIRELDQPLKMVEIEVMIWSSLTGPTR